MFKIDWDSLRRLENAALISVNEVLKSLRENSQLPPFLDDIFVTDLSFGSLPPTIELYDICPLQMSASSLPLPETSAETTAGSLQHVSLDWLELLLSGLDGCVKVRVHYRGSAFAVVRTAIHVQQLVVLPLEFEISKIQLDGLLCFEIDSANDELRVFFEPHNHVDDVSSGMDLSDSPSFFGSDVHHEDEMDDDDEFNNDDDDDDDCNGGVDTDGLSKQSRVLHGIEIRPRIGAPEQARLSVGIDKVQFLVISFVKNLFRDRLLHPNCIRKRGLRTLFRSQKHHVNP
ncbi:mitochondrial ERMES protein Mdm12 [Andalucia godoyi]|uniref:Mitochondrial ERMES protein Mdm12 n=1 Tax=Andalucia godoyi TaxID=505711 RepID=A0A8K0AG31_ANDGO|nr:mitochondrial ERMES protein Mdm12 [Andalucia godoyi]|eukprot:ANDGO_00755.mRNA.1 mitochondrial ERMES protein Mdm12